MKPIFKKSLPLLCAVLLSALIAGCGYHMGSLMHPQIKTIAIAIPVNETLMYNAVADMRTLLSEQFMLDGSLKVVRESKADCVVHVRIISVDLSEVTEQSYNEYDSLYMPDEWQAKMTAEFTVVIPGRKEPLIARRTVTGSANFQAPGDMDSSRLRGVRQACREVARNIVVGTTEAW